MNSQPDASHNSITVTWIPEMELNECVDIRVNIPTSLLTENAEVKLILEHTEGIISPNGSLKQAGENLEKSQIYYTENTPFFSIPLSVNAEKACKKKYLNLIVEIKDLVEWSRHRASLELAIRNDSSGQSVNVHVAGNMLGSNVVTDNEAQRVSEREYSLPLQLLSRSAVNPLVEGNLIFQRRYKLLKNLGAGGFGVVWLAQLVGQTGKKSTVALKFLGLDASKNPREMRMLDREADKLATLSHENIIGFRGLEAEVHLIALAQEYANSGSLDSKLQANKRGYFTTAEITVCVEQIILALAYLHRKKIVHRDIKPHNILIDEESETPEPSVQPTDYTIRGMAKIADFGLSGRLKNSLIRSSKGAESNENSSGTLIYSAPQVLLREGAYSQRDDLYSLGVLIFELLTGVLPYDDAASDALLTEYIKSESTPMPSLQETGSELYDDYPEIDPHWQTLVAALTAYHREDRPASADEALDILNGKSETQQKREQQKQEELRLLAVAEKEAKEKQIQRENEQAREQELQHQVQREQEKKKIAQEKETQKRLETQQKKQQEKEAKQRAKQEKLRLATLKKEQKQAEKADSATVGTKKSSLKIASILSILAVVIGLSFWQPWNNDNNGEAKAEREQQASTIVQKVKSALERKDVSEAREELAMLTSEYAQTKSYGRKKSLESSIATLEQEQQALRLANAKSERERIEKLAREKAEREKAERKAALAQKAEQEKRRFKGSYPGERREFEIAPGLKVAFCWCPAGEFEMGSPKSEKERDNDETQHKVILSKGFWLAETECTQAQWKAVMGTTPAEQKAKSDSYGRVTGVGANHPMYFVNWDDTQSYLRKLRLPAGLKASLPTEAQWEYACRAKAKGERSTPFHTGNNLSTAEANYNGNYPYNGGAKGKYRESTVEVRSFKSNAWGLYDMHGNVWEWCSDWYGDYRGGTQTDPTGAKDGQSRVLRGGCWNDNAWSSRSANRFRFGPGFRFSNNGFRLSLQVAD